MYPPVNQLRRCKALKKSVKFLSFFVALTLLFSCFLVPGASTNDKKFDNYNNMGENAKNNSYNVPNLFRQDSPYSNVSRFPLVVKNGVEYVPLSMFILYSYVEVNYSKTGEDFFLLNNKNNRYISFNVKEGVASTHDGDLLKLSVQIFNNTRYIPARTVAVVLGFQCESYDDPARGIYAFRVYDEKASGTLSELVNSYISQIPESHRPKPPVNNNEDDPIKKLARRRVEMCFSDISTDSFAHIMNTLDAYRVKASFSVSYEDVTTMQANIRRIYVSGHSLLVTSKAEGETPKEYADSFVEGLEKANEALGFVLKKTTRMCTLPADIPEEIKNSKEFCDAVEDAGYLIFTPNLVTDDKPGYTGNAYNVSSKIKSSITGGYDEKQEADISVMLWCSDRTPYYTADVANLVNKYAQFEFRALNEAFVYNKGE